MRSPCITVVINLYVNGEHENNYYAHVCIQQIFENAGKIVILCTYAVKILCFAHFAYNIFFKCRPILGENFSHMSTILSN